MEMTGSRYLNVSVLSAKNGDLPMAMAAYIWRTTLDDAVTGERLVFGPRPEHKKRKASKTPPGGRKRRSADDVVHKEVMLPKGADQSFADPEILWSAMERAEVRRTPKRTGPGKQTKAAHAALLARIDSPGEKRLTREELALAWRDRAQFAYHIVVALPWTLTEAQNIALIRAFIAAELLPHNFICQLAVHRPHDGSPRNIHAHILVATREVKGVEVGNKIRDVLATFANKPGGGGFNSRESDWPDRWAAFQEDLAHRIGVDLKVAPKAAVPEPHRGLGFHKEGTELDQAWQDAKAASKNAIQIPGLLPDLISEVQASFTPAEAIALVMRHGHSPAEADSVMRILQAFPGLVPLFEPNTGRFAGRFTTETVRADERELARLTAYLHDKAVHPVRHAKLRQSIESLAAIHPDRDLRRMLETVAGHERLVLLEPGDDAGNRLLLALAKTCRQAGYKDVLGLASTTGGACRLRTHLKTARTLAAELRAQALLEDPAKAPPSGTAPSATTSSASKHRGSRANKAKKSKPAPWSARTCLIISDADQIDPVSFQALFRRAARTGARVILLGTKTPHQAIGRGGAYAVIRGVLSGMRSTAGSEAPLAPCKPEDRRLPSFAFAARGDRALAGGRHAPIAQAAESVPAAPRPWRWPGAGLMDIHNLALSADCAEVGRRLGALPPAEMFTVYKTLPGISDSDRNPNPHPLALLRRQARGRLRDSGVDPIRGGTDVNCLDAVPIANKHSWKNLSALAPRPGRVDVRRLLAPTEFTDLADWHNLAACMKRFPKSVLVDILAGLDDLVDRSIGEEISRAVRLARLQVYMVAKESGQDLVPEVDRKDLWSIIPAAERLYAGIIFDDQDGAVPLILAATLPPPGYRTPDPIVLQSKNNAREPEPIWLRQPAWSPRGEYGVHPEGGERREHFLALCDASDEQRSGYRDALLRVYAASHDLAMRAWCAIGLQHCASWHRQTDTPMPVELEIVDQTADFAIVDWRLERGFQGNPFEAARGQFWLERMANEFLDADTRDRQLALAEQIAALGYPRGAPDNYKSLLAALQAPANLLRLSSGTPDLLALGTMLTDLKRRLGRATDDPSVDRGANPDSIKSATPRQAKLDGTIR